MQRKTSMRLVVGKQDVEEAYPDAAAPNHGYHPLHDEQPLEAVQAPGVDVLQSTRQRSPHNLGASEGGQHDGVSQGELPVTEEQRQVLVARGEQACKWQNPR